MTTIASGPYSAGRHTVEWNGTDARGGSVASGIYFYRIMTSKFTATRKLILLK